MWLWVEFGIPEDSKVLVWLDHCLIISWATPHSRACECSLFKPLVIFEIVVIEWVLVVCQASCGACVLQAGELISSFFLWLNRYLDSNQLNGSLTIPSDIGPSLKTVSLQNNKLSGFNSLNLNPNLDVGILWVFFSRASCRMMCICFDQFLITLNWSASAFSSTWALFNAFINVYASSVSVKLVYCYR